jgi:hypothetical protein
LPGPAACSSYDRTFYQERRDVRGRYSLLGHKGTRTTEEVYIHPQEVIDMTSPAFEAYGNQFGNQPAEGEIER